MRRLTGRSSPRRPLPPRAHRKRSATTSVGCSTSTRSWPTRSSLPAGTPRPRGPRRAGRTAQRRPSLRHTRRRLALQSLVRHEIVGRTRLEQRAVRRRVRRTAVTTSCRPSPRRVSPAARGVRNRVADGRVAPIHASRHFVRRRRGRAAASPGCSGGSRWRPALLGVPRSVARRTHSADVAAFGVRRSAVPARVRAAGSAPAAIGRGP